MRLSEQRRDRKSFLSLYQRFIAKDLQTADARANVNSSWRQLVMQQIGQTLSQPDLRRKMPPRFLIFIWRITLRGRTCAAISPRSGP